MIGKAFTTVAKSACAAVFALTLTGAAFAVDFTNVENSAREASNQIDRNLQQSARDLTNDLRQVNIEEHQAGRTGASAQAEQALNQTINQANRDLYTAADRDNYTFKRRQLENTQLLYAPGTRQYNDINNQIAQLDRDFAREMNDNRNVANRGNDSQSVMNRNWVNSDTNTASTDFNRDRMFETNYSTNNQNRYMNDQNRFMNDQNRFMDNQNRLLNNNDQNRDWEENWDRYNTSDDMNRMDRTNRTNQFRNTPSTTTSSTFDRTIGGTNVYNTNMNNAANRTSTFTTTVGTPATGTLTPLTRAATTTTTTRTVGAMTTPTMNTATTGTTTPTVGTTAPRVTTPAVRSTDTGGSFNSAAANMTMSGIGNMSTPTTGTASTGTNIGSTGVGAPVMGNNSTSNTNR